MSLVKSYDNVYLWYRYNIIKNKKYNNETNINKNWLNIKIFNYYIKITINTIWE